MTVTRAQQPTPQAQPTWHDEIAQGRVPYHQVTVEDFAIDDRAHPEATYWVKTFVDPRYHFMVNAHNGFVNAFVIDWLVFSGLDKGQTSRKSSFHEMKTELPYAQALLDLNELYARQLAALKTGELPQAHSASFEEARAELERKLKIFCQDKYNQIQAEMTAFSKATNQGQNKKKVRDLGAEIRKRLNALPAPPPPQVAPAVTPEPSPTTR